jgi:tRNA nucleotidyltransferase/poly(A) polymerase
VSTLRIMAEAGVLRQVLPESGALRCLERLVDMGEGDALLRLASLTSRRADVLTGLAGRWKLSTREKVRLRCMAAGEADVPADLSDNEARAQVYWLGPDRFRDLVLLAWAADGEDRRHLAALAERWSAPRFPLKGADLLGQGIPAGERVGALLRTLERQWVEEGFEPSGAELLARIQDID